MMTNFAFIFGLFSLVMAKGAGAATRHAVGIPVFGGMIAAAIFRDLPYSASLHHLGTVAPLEHEPEQSEPNITRSMSTFSDVASFRPAQHRFAASDYASHNYRRGSDGMLMQTGQLLRRTINAL